MAADKEIQVQFFDWLKANSEADQLVPTLEDLLCTSRDSVYRRMRGETLLTFNEISKISKHFNISVDRYLNLTSETVLFQSRVIGEKFTFVDYLHSINDNLGMIRKFARHEMSYLAKDIPIFYYFQYPELTEFKLFFWMKTTIGDSSLDSSRFHPGVIDKSLLELCHSIWRQFEKVPSVEIWSNETVNVTLSQVNYYLESELITEETAQKVLSDFMGMIQHLRLQAKHGRKFTQGTDPSQSVVNSKFNLYFNEVEIGDNTILFKMDDQKMVFKPFNMLNTISTTDARFCQLTEDHISRVITKSTPLSSTSEKERNRFFNRMEEKVSGMMRTLSF